MVMIIVGLVILVYWVIPDLLGHLAQLGTLAGSGSSNRVAFTFDDGPGPDTARLLDTLSEWKVPATFFVITERAEQHPDLIRRMVAEGHEVALHGWHHRSAWLLTPWGTVREMLEGRAAILRITGQRPRYYRPPWGHHNLVTWFLPGLLGMRRVLWTVAPDDWREDRSPGAIQAHVTRYLGPGAIVVLHDAGGDRTRTVEAMPAMAVAARALALEPVTVRDLPRETSLVRRGWFWWENQFTRMAEVDTVPASDGAPPSVRLGRAVYRGPRLTLPDGRVIEPGAVMTELHFQNPTLGGDSQSRAAAVHAYQRIRVSLYDVARFIREHPRFQDGVLVGGVTVLDASNAIARLGFQRQPVGGFRMFWMRLYLIFLMAVYHAQGFRVFLRLARLKPVLIWMTQEEYLARYGGPPPAPRSPARGAPDLERPDRDKARDATMVKAKDATAAGAGAGPSDEDGAGGL
jgi:peptidoglycan/xylan/chitin deacetylase (PgdA/CDA1 family)